MDEQGSEHVEELALEPVAVVRKRAAACPVGRAGRGRRWPPARWSSRPPTTTATSVPACRSTWPAASRRRRRRGRRRLVDAGVGHLRPRRRPAGPRRRGHRLPPHRRRRRGPGARARRRPRPRRRRGADGPTGRGGSPARTARSPRRVRRRRRVLELLRRRPDCVQPTDGIVGCAAAGRADAGDVRSRRRRRAHGPRPPCDRRCVHRRHRRRAPSTTPSTPTRLPARAPRVRPTPTASTPTTASTATAPPTARTARTDRAAATRRRGRGARRPRSTVVAASGADVDGAGSPRSPAVRTWFVTVEPVVDGIPSGLSSYVEVGRRTPS